MSPHVVKETLYPFEELAAVGMVARVVGYDLGNEWALGFSSIILILWTPFESYLTE